MQLIDSLTNGTVTQMNLDNGRDALKLLENIDEDYDKMKNLIWSRNVSNNPIMLLVVAFEKTLTDP